MEYYFIELLRLPFSLDQRRAANAVFARNHMLVKFPERQAGQRLSLTGRDVKTFMKDGSHAPQQLAAVFGLDALAVMALGGL